MATLRLPGMSGTRDWVYPQSIDGSFMRLRRVTFLLLHVILFAAPWITVKGHPLLQIDLPARRVFLFGAIFTPSDTIFLALLLFFLAFSLFFFTAIFGRIWCGYACPQTVFLESWIRPIELWIEGDRLTRKRRDARGWTFFEGAAAAICKDDECLWDYNMSEGSGSLDGLRRSLKAGRRPPLTPPLFRETLMRKAASGELRFTHSPDAETVCAL